MYTNRHSERHICGRGAGIRAWFQRKKVKWISHRASHKLDLDAHQREKLSVFINALMEQRRQSLIPDDVRISDILRLEGIDHERLMVLTNEAVEHHKQRANAVLEAFDSFYESLTESQRQRVRAYVDRWQYGCHHHACA